MTKLASVHPISDDIDWPAKAVFGSAMEQIPEGCQEAIAMWVTQENGEELYHYTKSVDKKTMILMLMTLINRLTA